MSVEGFQEGPGMGQGGQIGLDKKRGGWQAIPHANGWRQEGERVRGNGTMRKLMRQRAWEPLSSQSRPREALGPAFGALPEPPQSPAWVIPEQEQEEVV